MDGKPSSVCANTGQDAEFGRDARLPSNKNGQAGFRFTKLDASGASLPASAPAWSCVRDDVSGPTWEIRSAEPGLRYFNNIYSYSAAEAFAANVNKKGLCGKTDWRLPTRLETDTLQLSLRLPRRNTAKSFGRRWFCAFTPHARRAREGEWRETVRTC